LIIRAGGDGPPLPAAAEAYFRLDRLLSDTGTLDLPAGYAVLVVLAGDGELRGGTTRLPVRTGMTVLVPAGAGPLAVSGEGLELLCCRPPALSR
jgi:mannose-6-phosphate isomerase